MDRPNTNWKFFKFLKRYRLENEQHQLIDIGYCGLHIIHGTFKTGAESTNWGLKKVLQEAFILLHDSPTRRGDYVSLTGSDKFPLSFWAKMWIKKENLLIY